MKPDRRSVERWLVLDAAVYGTLASLAEDSGALLHHRVVHGLLEHVPLHGAAARISVLGAAGFSAIHLVVERLQATHLVHFRSATREGSTLRVHDWYGSPTDTAAAADAPDAFILHSLLHAQSPTPIQLWPPVGPNADLAGFLPGYRMALAVWEGAARETWGAGFTRLYGTPPIEWSRLLPDPRPTLGASLREIVRTAARATFFDTQLPHAGLAYAMPDEESPGSLLWRYRVGDVDMEIRVELPSSAGADVQLYATLDLRAEPPAALALVDASGAVIVSAITSPWTPHLASERQVSYHRFSDEFGLLRARFQALRTRPDLLLLPQ